MGGIKDVLHNRVHAKSYGTKALFWGIHLVAVVAAAWLTKEAWSITRVRACLFAIVLYFFRHGITLFYLLQRKIPLEEVGTVGTFMMVWVPLSAYLSVKAPPLSLPELGLAMILVFIGSFLNSYSEMQRKWWKALPENKGKCYTGGLWRYVVHINYTGDVILFSGWALLSGYYASLILPALMAYNFAYVQGPELDAYLTERYKGQFTKYLNSTGYLIPRLR